jgi:phasin family protein
MADAPQNFADIFKRLGDQLRVPFFDMGRIMEQHQKNLDAMTRSWQAFANGSTTIANKQRALVEAAVREVTEMAKEFKPTGSTQEIFAKQTEFAKRAMEAAIANTRDIAEVAQHSGHEALTIIHERMQESLHEIMASLERKQS